MPKTSGNSSRRSRQWQNGLDANSLWRSLPQPPPDPARIPFQLEPPHPPNSLYPPYPPPPDRLDSFSLRERRPPPCRPFESDRPDFSQVFNTQLATRRTSKAVWRVGAIHSPQTQIAIAVNLQAIDREMASIRNIFLISIPIEFVELIFVFNQMLERLERSFKQASRFSGDAAHELKTPLAILQGQLERALHQVESGSEVQQTLSNLLDEVRRLTEITRKLLLLSLADAGRMGLHLVEVNMSALLSEIAEDMELLAPHLDV